MSKPEILENISTDQLRRIRSAMTGNPNDASFTTTVAAFIRNLIDQEISHPDRVERDKDIPDPAIEARRQADEKTRLEHEANQASASATAVADTRSAWRDPQTAR